MNRRHLLKSAAADRRGSRDARPREPGRTAHRTGGEPDVPARSCSIPAGRRTTSATSATRPARSATWRSASPRLRVVCWLRKTNPDVTAMLRRRFPDVPLVEGSLRRRRPRSTPELQAAFDAADLFMQNSGMHFTRFWSPPSGLLRACIARSKPFGLYAQSFDGFRDEDAATLPGLLSRAAFIFCRDTESLRFLRAAGVTPGILEFGPDGCFGIDVRDDARADAFLREHDLRPRRFITVTLRTDKEVSANKGADDPDRAPGDPEDWYAKLREVIAAWVERTGDRVVLVPEVEKEIGPAKRLLLDRLPGDVRSRVVHRDRFWNVDEAVSLYAKAHAVVSMEPHSCIMALAVGTPAIHAFSRNHGYKAWMFRDVGLPEWLIDIDAEPAGRVTTALDRIHDRYDLALGKVRRAMDFVNARSAEMMGDVRLAMTAAK